MDFCGLSFGSIQESFNMLIFSLSKIVPVSLSLIKFVTISSKEYDIQRKALDFQLLLHLSKYGNHWSSLTEEKREDDRGEVTQSR